MFAADEPGTVLLAKQSRLFVRSRWQNRAFLCRCRLCTAEVIMFSLCLSRCPDVLH